MQHKITPKEYNRILEGLQPVIVSLESLSAWVDRENAFEMDTTLSAGCKDATFVQGGENVVVIASYRCRVRKGRKVILKIDATYRVEFSSEEPFSDEFFDTYKESSLQLLLWPFFRELVYDITSKMYIPPLVLPFQIVYQPPKE